VVQVGPGRQRFQAPGAWVVHCECGCIITARAEDPQKGDRFTQFEGIGQWNGSG